VSSVQVVLHPRTPKGVPAALAEVEGVELVQPEPDAFEAVAREAEILVTSRWSSAWIGQSLRWVQAVSTGYENFDVDALGRAGVVLTTARGVHGPQMAEHAFGLLLALSRGIGVSMREAEHHTWRPRSALEIGGRTMAVLGLGSVGEEIARRAVAWGIDVVGTKRTPDGYEGVASRVWGMEGTIEACLAADIVVSVLPGGPETRHIIGEEELAAIGAGWFVSVGRGTVVDESALLRALDDGPLLGAGLDVFETEPLPEASPLWGHPRVVLTPHMGGYSPGYGPRLAEILRANLRAHRGDGEWVNRVL
jgi:D-2-hydroxyacid dehydrogenase (NADP+)